MASKGLIVVPKPGQLIHELAAVAAPPDAATLHAIEAATKATDDAYARAKMAQSDAAFKQLSLGDWGSLPTVVAAKAAGETQRMNAAIFTALSEPSKHQAAIDAVNDFTRAKMKEEGYLHKLMPPLQISDDELDRAVDTDKPVMVVGVDLGNGHQGGHAMSLASGPDGIQIQNSWGGSEVGHITKETFFDALQLAKDLPYEPPGSYFSAAEVAAIAKWGNDEPTLSADPQSPGFVGDIKEILAQNAIKDMLSEIDASTIKAFSDPTFIGKSYAVEDSTTYVKKESHLLEFFAYETMGATIGHTGGLAGVDLGGGDDDDSDPWADEGDDDDEIDEETSVDIVFWYYRDTFLVYSVRRVSDNFFYDFATKKFSMMPASPRAGMPRAEPAKPSGFCYWTKLSGKLDDGEYVVTIRDTKGDDAVVGITALFMKGGIQQGTPPQGLEDTPIEEGIPTPEGTFRRAARRVRPVDVGGSE